MKRPGKPKAAPIGSRSVSVGTFGGRAVWDVFTRTEDEFDDRAKVLLVEHEGLFCPIYYGVWGSTSGDLGDTQVIDALGRPVLETRSRIFGTGNYFDEVRWVVTADQELKRLDLSHLAPEIVAALPEGHGIWKGGGFDLSRLHYHKSVWKDGDGNCCPSGGTVTIQYKWDGDRLAIASMEHRPDQD